MRIFAAAEPCPAASLATFQPLAGKSFKVVLVTPDEWDRQQSVLSSLRASYAERERIIHALCAELAALSARKDTSC